MAPCSFLWDLSNVRSLPIFLQPLWKTSSQRSAQAMCHTHSMYGQPCLWMNISSVRTYRLMYIGKLTIHIWILSPLKKMDYILTRIHPYLSLRSRNHYTVILSLIWSNGKASTMLIQNTKLIFLSFDLLIC